MPTAGNPRLTIRFEEYQLAQIKALAHNQGIRPAELIRQITLDYIAQQQEETPQP